MTPPIPADAPTSLITKLMAGLGYQWLSYSSCSDSAGWRGSGADLASELPEAVDVAGMASVVEIRRKAKQLGLTGILPGIELVVDDQAWKSRHLGYPAMPSAKRSAAPPRQKVRLPVARTPSRPLSSLVRRHFGLEPAMAGRVTNQRYKAHFEFLGIPWEEAQSHERSTEWFRKHGRHAMKEKLIIALTSKQADRVLFYSTYFAIPKPGKAMRTIFNGKELSTHWKPPPSVNIPDMPALIREIRLRVKKHKKKLHVVMGDFRHWFHQIPLNHSLRWHFGLAMDHGEKAKSYLWRCLPMGWSYSPWIAQSFAWFVVANRESNGKELFKEDALKQEQLPTFLETKEGGLATVYYDNFLLVTPSEAEATLFDKRVKSTCKNYNVTIKPGSYERHDEHSAGFSYLGVQFEWTEREGAPSLRWRASKLEKWKETHPHPEIPNPDTTARDRSSLLGKIIFHLHISTTPIPLCPEGRAVLSAASLIGRVGAQNWDTPLALPEAIWDPVLSLWSRIVDERIWHSDSPENPSPQDLRSQQTLVLATDASQDGYGWIAFLREVDGSLKPLCTHEITQPDSSCDACYAGLFVDVPPFESRPATTWHIYEKEMWCAVDALLQWTPPAHVAHLPVILAVDNTAALWGLRQGFTNHHHGGALLQKVEPLLPSIRAVQVASAHNPSDCHSRDDYSSLSSRIRYLETALTAELAGHRIGQPNQHDGKKIGGIRHGVPDEDFCGVLESGSLVESIIEAEAATDLMLT